MKIHGLLIVGIVLSSVLQGVYAEEKQNAPVVGNQPQTQVIQPAIRPAAPNKAKKPPALPKNLFERALNSNFPLNPDEVRKTKRAFDAIQKARVEPISGKYPDPISQSLIIDLEPGSRPNLIKTTQGYKTSVSFFDGTGAPWPIADYGVGANNAFKVVGTSASNTITIFVTQSYVQSNLQVTLDGMTSPISFTLRDNSDQVHYAVSATVPGLGPNAKELLADVQIPNINDKNLLAFLDNVPPRDAQVIPIVGDRRTKVWIWQGKQIVRSSLHLTSPGYDHVLPGVGGVRVYVMSQQSPVLLMLTQQGKALTLNADIGPNQSLASANALFSSPLNSNKQISKDIDLGIQRQIASEKDQRLTPDAAKNKLIQNDVFSEE